MRVTVIGGIFCIIVLIVLHITYVEAAIVKSLVLLHANASTTTPYGNAIDSSIRKVLMCEQQQGGKDTVSSDQSETLISRTCLEYTLATWPQQQRSNYFQMHGDDNDNDDDKTRTNTDDTKQDKTHNRTTLDTTTIQELQLFSKHETLRTNTLYGGTCTGKYSRFCNLQQHYLSHPGTNDTDTGGVVGTARLSPE